MIGVHISSLDGTSDKPPNLRVEYHGGGTPALKVLEQRTMAFGLTQSPDTPSPSVIKATATQK